ncbi:MAG: hypothetical protein M1546_12680, partial [Chloroflexi bacterium]|nr:hypothetical protein [Chloroflexota bacterium]
TITSSIPDASSIAKEFRDGKRTERVAVSVDMLSTGYNCRDLLNVVLMRPIFSPTEYIQIKGRGTRRYTFHAGNSEYEKQYYFLLDFCGVAEYFEEKYDYSIALKLPRAKPKVTERGQDGAATAGTPAATRETGDDYGAAPDGDTEAHGQQQAPADLPVWEGKDQVVSEAVRIVGPNGEKVDVMTFRGSFERDLADFALATPALQEAVEDEDDDAVETILSERFFHKPEMFYSPDKLALSYGVPAPAPAFAYHVLRKKPLPTQDDLLRDTVDSIAARFNLRYNDTRWVNATLQLMLDNPAAFRRFMDGDMTLFASSQFSQLGGLNALARFQEREAVFEAMRQSGVVRQMAGYQRILGTD